MVPSTAPDEYSDIVRLYRPSAAPIGHIYVKATAPSQILRICRDHTLGRGRILYEVVDTGRPIIIGYVVPAEVYQLASRYADGVNHDSWRIYQDHQQKILQDAHWLLKIRFPRLPDIAAQEVPENAWRRRWRDDHDALEDLAVQYALHQWTSYDFRFDGLAEQLPHVAGKYVVSNEDPSKAVVRHDKRIGREHWEVFEIIKPRLRQVLRSWMSRDVGIQELSTFYRRHKLVDAAEMRQLGSGCVSPESGGSDLTLLSYGGAETLGNVTLRADFFT